MSSTQSSTLIQGAASRHRKYSSPNGAGRFSSVQPVKRVSNAPRWPADLQRTLSSAHLNTHTRDRADSSAPATGDPATQHHTTPFTHTFLIHLTAGSLYAPRAQGWDRQADGRRFTHCSIANHDGNEHNGAGAFFTGTRAHTGDGRACYDRLCPLYQGSFFCFCTCDL
jgi:hypothetical protein